MGYIVVQCQNCCDMGNGINSICHGGLHIKGCGMFKPIDHPTLGWENTFCKHCSCHRSDHREDSTYYMEEVTKYKDEISVTKKNIFDKSKDNLSNAEK